jgi:hypothetical protein
MTDKGVAKVDTLEWDMTWDQWSRKIWPALCLERRQWSMKRTYDLMHSLVKTAHTLKAEAGTPMPLRSSAYRMIDAGIMQGTVSSAATNLGYIMSWLRDYSYIPWDLFSDDSVGQAKRGMTSDELETYIKSIQRTNVIPVLENGVLHAIWVEKAGLVNYLRKATRYQVPVGSPEGNIRKAWAHENWIPDVLELAHDMGGELEIIYCGDGDKPGWKIYETVQEWLYIQFSRLELRHYAVTESQLEEIHREEIHLDGYIAHIGPQVFALRLRKYLGMETKHE